MTDEVTAPGSRSTLRAGLSESWRAWRQARQDTKGVPLPRGTLRGVPRTPVGWAWNEAIWRVPVCAAVDQYWWERHAGLTEGLSVAFEALTYVVGVVALRLPPAVYIPLARLVSHADEIHMTAESVLAGTSKPIDYGQLFERTRDGRIIWIGPPDEAPLARRPTPRRIAEGVRGLWSRRGSLAGAASGLGMDIWKLRRNLPKAVLTMTMPLVAGYIGHRFGLSAWAVGAIAYSPYVPYLGLVPDCVRKRSLDPIFHPQRHAARERAQVAADGAEMAEPEATGPVLLRVVSMPVRILGSGAGLTEQPAARPLPGPAPAGNVPQPLDDAATSRPGAAEAAPQRPAQPGPAQRRGQAFDGL